MVAIEDEQQTFAPNAVELDWYDEGETVRVFPRDQQRFEIQKDKAIGALQLASNAELQLDYLLDRLAIWIRAHESHLRDAWLTLRNDRFVFLAISKAPEYNEDLEDAVSDLDLAIANDPDLNLLRMNAMVLPPASTDALSSFFDDRFALVYRGRRS